MTQREVKEVLESYRDADGKMRYALKGAVIDDATPKKAAPRKQAAAPRKAARRK